MPLMSLLIYLLATWSSLLRRKLEIDMKEKDNRLGGKGEEVMLFTQLAK